VLLKKSFRKLKTYIDNQSTSMQGLKNWKAEIPELGIEIPENGTKRAA